MLMLFVGISLSNVLCVFYFDCDRITQQSTNDNGHIHVREIFMTKLGALPIRYIIQRLCSYIIYFQFVISVKFCYHKIGHFVNFL
jgi:hypothetical protein